MNNFTGIVELFPQDKGWHYVGVPSQVSQPLEHLADRGLIAITATVGESSWPTSFIPKGDGTHFLALPAKVRKAEGLTLGDQVTVGFETRVR
ncbi:MAG: DUF1905 domain-containing protein [Propionibacteriaceae bacterium]|jgi:hypothetical protein|nr:DUF1905 domain-containing protein [Propionibacteriaceae bacterium]